MADNEDSGTFETRADAGEGGSGVYRFWTSALELQEKEERRWRKRADAVNKRFRDEEDRKGSQFNILYSSVQTQEPAIYNSTPIPDVRRRYADEDPVGKVAAQIFERTISHCMDEYDFDCGMEGITHDSLTVGRGVGMVEYKPIADEEGEEEGDGLAYEMVKHEHVAWDDFRRGPGRKWSEVPWVAVRYRITREAAKKLNPKEGPTVNLDYVDDKKEDTDMTAVADTFKRLTVWKIWDKTNREIIFIAPSYKKGAFAKEADTLKLEDFFPFPRPVYDIVDPNSMIPVIPYEMYRDQAEELDNLTKRIRSLVNVLKWRGIGPSQIPELFDLKDAEDGEILPSQSFDAISMMAGANADKAIWLMPIDKLIIVIRELVIQREAVKQVVFEISGLADVMRGETNPNETLGAQQLKAQWGSMRMQRRQREVQRYARDVIRMKAEIIGEHFSTETLAMISGMKLMTAEQKAMGMQMVQQAKAMQQEVPPEVQEALSQPTWDEVKALMGSDQMRSYRVDIETDSTIQADLGRNQQNMAQFVEGLAAFGQAVGPAIQSGLMEKSIAADLLTGFSRNFKLGKQAEDALERWGQEAKKPSEPDPAMIAQQQAQQAVEMEKEKTAQAQAIESAKTQEADAAKAMKDQNQAQIDAQRAQDDGMERERERLFKEEQRQIDRIKMEVEAKKAEVEMARLHVENEELGLSEEDHAVKQDAMTSFMEAIKVMSEGNQQNSVALAEAVALLAQAAETMAAASMAPRHARLTKGANGEKMAVSEVVLQ